MTPAAPTPGPPAGAITAGTGRAEALRWLGGALRAAGIANPELDARILLTETLGVPFAAVLAEPAAPLGGTAAAGLTDAVARRLAGEPVGRILGMREFWGLPFALSPATLEPRPDTETLVAVALAHARGQGGGAPRVLDLGTGTGCILVAVLSELPQAWGLGVDRAAGAAATARHNARRNGVGERARFAVGNWAEAVGGPFNLVLSNPPYIASDDIAALAGEVRDHDPRLALDGGHDGLDAYRALAADLPRLLAIGGFAGLEVGQGQAPAVAELLRRAGLRDVSVTLDLTGVERVVSATR
ncbi:peptide chain release factor N(5)-glutamine methyltransferase [Chelatococcus reniformis]|uniref:Release factor glutamine methyltransferase n=1 Tax=Chelatococcus reniformis TaxID=1494448 RepID=A0A916X739_9HYPH|nr:peptide chain release factor N(5)-glutamine methyltransferase [Chelatococcus reniformis]GGC50281.1 release factor glutamine methyltransferase [Chelatococcus reniformis]